MDMVPSELTIGATEFKARCLDLMKRLADGRLRRVIVTRRGRPVAVMTAPSPGEDSARVFVGSMAAKTYIPDDFDLTKPAFEDEWDADAGMLYNE
jgi:prevent-host-death family protein